MMVGVLFNINCIVVNCVVFVIIIMEKVSVL